VSDPAVPAPDAVFRIAFEPGFRIDRARWVSVDTGARTARDDQGASIMGRLDWASSTWPILPVSPAVTYLHLDGTTTTGVTQVQAIWTDGYLT
jgi:hypothetical protein